MTDNENLTAFLVNKHKESIARILAKFSAEIAYRSAVHDFSKLSPDEFPIHSKYVEEFGKYEFNSKEFNELQEKLSPATSLHKKRNRHHPEYFEDGIDGMNLIDVLEMLSDWASAATRSPNGSIRKSLPILKDQFKISPQLLKILENTLRDFNMY